MLLCKEGKHNVMSEAAQLDKENKAIHVNCIDHSAVFYAIRRQGFQQQKKKDSYIL